MLRATLHEQEIRGVLGLPGEGNLVVDGVATLDAGEDRCLYFMEHDITGSVQEAFAGRNGCIVIAPQGSSFVDALGTCRVLQVAQPRAAIARVLEFIRAEARQPPFVEARKIAEDATISPMAVVEGAVEIGEGVVIEPFCTIGPEVVIGRGTVVRTGARIYPRVSIGDESVINANSVIGSQGYGFVRDRAGNKTRIPHLGGVTIGSYVEIGALSLVQCGTISPTIIEDYVKIDDHVHVGHNDRIARGASVTAGVIIGGSAVIGAECWIGINSSIRNGAQVGAHTLVGMDVSVQQDLDENVVARAPRPEVKVRLEDDRSAIGFRKL
jgi:UDP-3-O-[3-hydroxymyristoyl] glucosamine N-acyltransferase LpxD